MILSNAQIKTITSKDDPVLDPFKCFKMRNTGIYFISNPSVLDKFIDKNGISISDRGLLSIKILNKNIKEEESLIIPSVEINMLETQDTKIATVDGIEDLTTNLTSSMYVQVIYEYTTVTSKYYRWSYAINTDPNINDTTKPTVPTITDKESLKHIRATNFRSDWYYTYQSNVLYSRKWDFINDDNSIYNTDSMNDLFVRYDDEVLAEWNILKSYPTIYYPDQYNLTGGTNVNNTHYRIVEQDFVNSGNFINCLYLTDGKPEYEYTPVDDKLNIINVYNGINTYRNSFYINYFQNVVTFPSIIPFGTQNNNMPGYFIDAGTYYPDGSSPFFIISGTGASETTGIYTSDGDMVVTLGHAVKDRVVSIKTHIPMVANYLSYLTIHNTYGRDGKLLTRYNPNAFPTASVIADIKTKLLAQKAIMDSRFFTGIKLGAVQSYTTRTTQAASYNSLSVMHGCNISYSDNSLTTYTNLVQLEKDKKWINVQST